MQKIRIWGYSWLCLWLIFPVILCSCAVQHTGESRQKYVAADTVASILKVEVLMLSVKWMARVSGEGFDFVLQPYNIKNMGIVGNAHILQLSFHANNPEQANVLQEQLLATGAVEQVNVTKESN
jgi:hypothetical protein